MPKSLEGVLLMKALSLLITEEEARLCVFIIIRKNGLECVLIRVTKQYTILSATKICWDNLIGKYL